MCVHNNLRFAGQYFDNETATHYNINRDYNPITGRYIQSDPIGLDGGFSTFAYVNGNPVMLVDLEGLTGMTEEEERQEVIREQTQAILNDDAKGTDGHSPVPKTYKDKLSYLYNQNKVIYEPEGCRVMSRGQPCQNAYGTADISSGTIRVTTFVWSNFSGYVEQAVRHVIIHELRHIMTNCRFHIYHGETCTSGNENKWGFDNVLSNMGQGYYK